MDSLALTFSSGWASGINAYLVVLVLGIADRVGSLAEIPDVLARWDVLAVAGFLFVDDDALVRHEQVDEAGREVVAAAHDALAGLGHWSTAAIEEALRASLVEGLGLKPRHAFGPVRVAVTGRKVSPPLFESLELLGRDRSLARLSGALP